MEERNESQDNRELYALLNLSPESSDEEIRRAYRQWAQAYHPDKYQAPHVSFPLFPYVISFSFALSSLVLFSFIR